MGFQGPKSILDGLSFNGTQAAPALCDFQNAKRRLRVQNKTAAYSVLETDSGTLFTTYGASGSITFTLPATPTRGVYFDFLNMTANDLVVAAATADTLYAYGDSAADSVAITDIGVLMRVIGTGDKWVVVSFGDALAGATEAVTT